MYRLQMELGPEDVSLLERCPHFRGCYVQASMELGSEEVSSFQGCYMYKINALTAKILSISFQKWAAVGMGSLQLFMTAARSVSAYSRRRWRIHSFLSQLL